MKMDPALDEIQRVEQYLSGRMDQPQLQSADAATRAFALGAVLGLLVVLRARIIAQFTE